MTFTAAVPDDDRYFPARDLFVALSATDASSTLPYFELQRPFPDNADPTSGDTALYYRIPVVEDDLPGVWITAAETSVSESEPACFTLGIDGVLLPGSDGPTGLRVDLDVTQQGDSLRGSPGNRTETLDSLPHTMCLELRDDDVGEEDGAVTVTITPADDRYRIGDPGSASVTVKDNDWRQMVGWDPLAPPDELTERSYWPLGASTSLSVWEGNWFCGYLQRWLVDPRGYYRTSEYHYHGFDLREPLPELTVRLDVQETRDDLLRTPTKTVRFSTAPTGVDRFHVKACYRSVEDDVINPRHMERFRVWIEPDPSYVRLPTPTLDNRSWWHPYLILDLQVQDDDLPWVTATAEQDPVQEGADVVLTLTRQNGDLVTPMDIYFTIRKKSTSGVYLGPRSGFIGKWYVSFGRSVTTVTRRWEMADNDVDEDDYYLDFEMFRSGASHLWSYDWYFDVSVSDDDERGVTVSPRSLAIAEGSTSSYDVVLDSEPTGNVTVAVTTDLAGTDLSLDNTPLMFTRNNWSTAQTITVSAEHDEDALDDAMVTLTHAVSGADYGGGAVTVPSVDVSIHEDDKEHGLFLVAGEPGTFAAVGDQPKVSFSVSNTGNVSTAAPVTVSSEQFGTVACGGAALAAEQAGVACTEAAYTVTQADVDAGLAVVQATATDRETVSNQVSVRLLYEPVQELTFEDRPQVTEGEDDTLELAVTLNPPSDQTVRVDFATGDAPGDQVSATSGSDYEAVSGTLRFAPGQTMKTISVPILTDDLDEPRERFRVDFSNPRHVRLPKTRALVTIVDDSSPANKPVASIEPTRPGRVYESEGVYQFDVVLSRPSGHALAELEITFHADGTATPGADYQELGGGQQVVRFAPEQTRATMSVPLSDDDLDEEDETLVVELATSGKKVDIHDTKYRAVGTIADDDRRGVIVHPAELTVDEGGSVTYTVVLTSQPTDDVTVAVNVPQDADLSVDQATLTFTADNWDGEQTVTVSAEEDADAAVDATVTLSHAVSGADYEGEAAAPVAVRITENDAPTLSMSDARAAESTGAVTFTVRLSVASSNAVTVDYATANGTAQAGSHYTATDGTLTFPANNTAPRTIRVPIADDRIDEEDRTFTVTLSDARHADLTGAQPTLAATGTIIDDDTRGVTVHPTALEVDEGRSATYTVVLDSQPTEDVTVAAAVARTAALAAEVTVAPASLTFTAGDWSTRQTVTVRAGQDDDAEPDAATIEHTVRGGLYAAVRAGDVAVTVNDDETASTRVTLTVDPQTVAEGVGPAGQTLTATASLDAAPRTAPTDVLVSVGAGTAGAADFTAVPDFKVTIPAGATSGHADFTLAPVDDAEDEPDETVTVSGTAISPELTVQGTTLTIVDNDAAAVTVAFDADRYTATEGGDPATVRVRLSGDPQRTVEIPISHTPDTRRGGGGLLGRAGDRNLRQRRDGTEVYGHGDRRQRGRKR